MSASPFASLSSSSSTSSTLLSTSSSLLSLPAVLLSKVCSYLSPTHLLATVARTAVSARGLLSVACFSQCDIELSERELLLLSDLPTSSFHTRVLVDCQLHLQLHSLDVAMQPLLNSLRHFRHCATLHMEKSMDDGSLLRLSDTQLCALLRHPTTRQCRAIILYNFHRALAELVPVEVTPDTRHNRSTAEKPFEWADFHFPSLTRLHLVMLHHPVSRDFLGGAAFLKAHSALFELHISARFVSVAELTAVFREPAALPVLSDFALYGPHGADPEQYYVVPLLIALATTEVGVSGKPRPMKQLAVDFDTELDAFAAASLMPLTRLRSRRTLPQWLQHWTRSLEDIMSTCPLLRQCSLAAAESAFPLLEECIVHTEEYEEQAPARDVLPFLQSVANPPLRLLDIRTGEQVTFTAAAMSQLARCSQLRELYIQLGAWVDEAEWMDWTDPALFASVTAGCFPCLQSIKLQQVKLSADAVSAVASAAPQLLAIQCN